MSWLHLVDNARFLETLFPEKAPSLESVRLHEVELRRDGPSVLLRFDLDEFPNEPPRKWKADCCNTVQIRLMAIGVRDLAIEGWKENNLGVIRIMSTDRGVQIEFTSESTRLFGIFDHVRVEQVTSYRDGEK